MDMTLKNLSVRAIPGYPGYFATSEGVILSFRHRNGPRKEPKKLNLFTKSDGYLQTQLRRPNGTSRSENVHRLVALAFLANPEKKPTVNHKNGLKKDNRVENLEWMTRREQTQHSLNILGVNPATWTKGNKFAARLSIVQVESIREALRSGETGASLAARFTVSTAAISNIRRGKSWA